MTFSQDPVLITRMVKKLIPFVAAGALGGCLQEATTPLARLGDSKMEVVGHGQLNVLLHVNDTSGCPRLGDDAVAKFDGQVMEVSRGGEADDATGCYPIAFWFNKPPVGDLTTFEAVNSSSELVVEDHSAQWSVGMTRVFLSDFVNDTNKSTITWTNVPLISTASLTGSDLFHPHVNGISISGNVITYPKGTVVTEVDAFAHPTPTRCEGPAECLVDLEGTRTFDPINP